MRMHDRDQKNLSSSPPLRQTIWAYWKSKIVFGFAINKIDGIRSQENMLFLENSLQTSFVCLFLPLELQLSSWMADWLLDWLNICKALERWFNSQSPVRPRHQFLSLARALDWIEDVIGWTKHTDMWLGSAHFGSAGLFRHPGSDKRVEIRVERRKTNITQLKLGLASSPISTVRFRHKANGQYNTERIYNTVLGAQLIMGPNTWGLKSVNRKEEAQNSLYSSILAHIQTQCHDCKWFQTPQLHKH